jgi:drug/metabolite transporter (DMT)-like permease
MSTQSSTSPRRGYLLAIAGTAAWSSSGIFIAYLTGQFRIPPLALAAWRNLIITAALFAGLALLARPLLRVPRAEWLWFLPYGLLLAALSGLFPLSVAMNGAAVATFLIYSAPLFSALGSKMLLGEPLGPIKIAAVVAGLGGCVLVSGAYEAASWEVNALGIAVGLGTGVSFAAYGLVGKRVARRGVHTWTAMAYAFLAATVFLFLLLRRDAVNWLADTAFGGGGDATQMALAWSLLAGLALGPTLGGHGFYIASLAHLPASTATLITTLEPPLTVLLAYLLLGERLETVQILGGLLVVVAVIGVTISDRLSRDRGAGHQTTPDACPGLPPTISGDPAPEE